MTNQPVSATAAMENSRNTGQVQAVVNDQTSTDKNGETKQQQKNQKPKEGGDDQKMVDVNEKEKEKESSGTSAAKADAKSSMEPEAAAVLAYLRKRGLGSAALELQRHLDGSATEASTTQQEPASKKAKTLDSDNNTTDTKDKKDKNDDQNKNIIEMDEKEIERKVDEAHENKSVLNLATGGGSGMGYDLDAAAEILIWNTTNHTDSSSRSTKVRIQHGNDLGNNENKNAKSASGDNDDGNVDDDASKSRKDKNPQNEKEQWQQNEATRYVRAFTALQTWILTLPNDDNGNNCNNASMETVLQHAKANARLIDDSTHSNGNNDDTENKTGGDNDDDSDHDENDAQNHDDKEDNEKTDKNEKEENSNKAHVIPPPNTAAKTITSSTTTTRKAVNKLSLTPKSIKPELLSLSFPLLIHTYCNLLQSGLEDTAHALLSTYRHIHEPFHPEEFLDLDKCSTQADMKKLNTLIKGHNDSSSKAKTIRRMKEKIKMEQERQKSTSTTSAATSTLTSQQQQQQLNGLDKQYKEVTDYFNDCQRQLKAYPFLKRARSVKWHIHLSALTFQILVRFFHSGDEGGIELLPMSGILQSHCHLVIENRDPVPYVPGFILEDMVLLDGKECEKNGINSVNVIQNDESDHSASGSRVNSDIRWAAPVDINSRLLESGEDADNIDSILKQSERLPFPKYYLKPQYATIEDYETDKKKVQFNRAILTNGFRRLEALEAKREYEVGVRLKYGSNANSGSSMIGNPMEPSIMFSTICASSNKSKSRQENGSYFPLNESNIDLTCAKLCLPDGRNVAAGCTDSAVRIWSMQSWNSYSGKSTVDSSGGTMSPRESTIVLVGHKKGLPVYSIDWNRDGRTLLSAGGDGSIRMWDSKAVGPFGKLTSVIRRTTKINTLSKKISKTIHANPGTHVPGAKPLPMVEQHGSALACFKGHANSTPVWSVAMAPSGYYFASAGSDSTARLWCTDRPIPVRIFMGHYSQNVNCLSWHPNCNYLFTGSDDKTIRMWDVQSGRSVRILSGCKFGINQVKISPSGQYVAGADYGGTVSIWDIRNGRKLDEFQHIHKDGKLSPFIHTMSYSPCGSTIATGGEDCSIRIWDARGIGNNKCNPDYATSIGWGMNSSYLKSPIAEDPKLNQSSEAKRDPVKTFYTSGSMILDLEFTKRNLLLSVGKYTHFF